MAYFHNNIRHPFNNNKFNLRLIMNDKKFDAEAMRATLQSGSAFSEETMRDTLSSQTTAKPQGTNPRVLCHGEDTRHRSINESVNPRTLIFTKDEGDEN